MADFTDFIRTLDAWGFTDVILPFVLIFATFFAVLQRAKILGEEKKNFNAVIAIVMSLMVVIPHVLGRYPANKDPVIIIARAIPNIAILLVVGLCFFILAGMVGIKPENYKDASYSFVTLILLNVFVINAYPSLANFTLIASVFIVAIALLMPGPGIFGTVPMISAALVFIIFHWAITGWTQTSLPNWLRFLENTAFQGAIIVILTFFTNLLNNVESLYNIS